MIENNDSKNFLTSAIIFIGSGGSGKTSLIYLIHKLFIKKNITHILINFDPSVKFLPFIPNLDIRDTVNYERTKKNFNLGPNSAILTSLNLFVTKINQLFEICNQFNTLLKYFICDTPGQIEVFLWSVSGYIIINLLKFFFKVCIIYMIDMKQCHSLKFLMVNLLIATTISYRLKSKFLIIWNKNDENNQDYYNYYSNHIAKFTYYDENNLDYLFETYEVFMDIYSENALKMFMLSYMSTISTTGLNEFLSFIESS
uniref:GPN-loop GTPase n=1 Tax=Lotharella vacuolata TaxID=74820 RepID=A0A0H5BH74_9EUKA|nr:ATP/GTP binding protein [Lotharella vacuolata]